MRKRRGAGKAPARKGPSTPGATGAGTQARPLTPQHLGAAAALVVPSLLAFALYVGGLNHPFVYDDVATVVDNPSLRDLSNWRFLLGFNRFRPVVNLSYALDVALAGMTPYRFHLTNLILHMVATGLFAVLARELARDQRAALSARSAAGASPGGDATARGTTTLAFAAATLFAIHPLMSEAVIYASARPEVLCAVFALLTLLAARRAIDAPRPVAWWTMAAIAWVLAAASRENGALVPLVFLVWDRLLLPRDERSRRRLLAFHLPLVGLVVAAGAFRVASFLRYEAGTLPRDVWQHFLSELPIYWRYLRLLVWPAGQTLVHPAQRVESALEPAVLGAAAAMVLVAVAAWLLRRRRPLAVFGVVWFALFLAPSSSLVPLLELMAEHRIYLASGGVFLVFAEGFVWLVERWRAAERRPAAAPVVVAIVVAILLAAATAARVDVWRDPVTLWRDAAVKAPLTWAPHYALADAVRQREGCAAALPIYQRAVELLPEDNRARLNLGICLAQGGRLEEAERAFATAVALDPTSADAHANLGRLAQMDGRLDEAVARFATALQHDPEHIPALFNLAVLYDTQVGDPVAALRLCRELLRLRPDMAAARECVQRNEARASGT
jgi:tetratricopeptide (TPR) repeat protein